MPKLASKNGRSARLASGTTKYDAHHTVLSKTYGALADLRRELSDSKSRVAEREDILRIFATCADSQRAWLLLEDYFEKLSLSRKDFGGQDWWPRMMAVSGKARLEEVAILFLRATRPLPTELVPHANIARFAELEQAEQEQRKLDELEHWLFPPAPAHLDGPRASIRLLCSAQPAIDHPALHALKVRINLFRPRTGEKIRPVSEIVELTTRATHEQELFSPQDWEFIQWLTETYGENPEESDSLILSGLDLLQWLARWGLTTKLEFENQHLQFHGQIVSLTPHLENGDKELSFTHHVTLPDGSNRPLTQARFFAGRPALTLIDQTFYLLRNVPPPSLLEYWAETPSVPVPKLSRRLRTQLRRAHSDNGVDWSALCTTHQAVPQFVFELNEETVRLRLLATSERDQSVWHWTGQEWTLDKAVGPKTDKPEVLEDARLDAAVTWLRRLDWFTPEPGMWVGDANENFLTTLARAWPDKPGGVNRVTSRRSSSWRFSGSTNLTAKPSGNSRITRPMQAPTANGVPIWGCNWAETATPDGDMSITRQACVVPSARVMMEWGVVGMMRASLRKSARLGSFCFFSSQVSLLANFSRIGRVISSSIRNRPVWVSVMLASNLPKSWK